MPALTRKLARDLWRLRGPVTAVGLVVACGVAVVVAMRSTYDSLLLSRDAYYDSYRFADVFARLVRAPEALRPRLASLPGVARADTRVVADVVLDVPGLAEPAVGRLVSLPDRGPPALNALHLRRGRWVDPERTDEALVSEAFAEANGLDVGDSLSAVIRGRWQRLRLVGVALSPEFIYEIRGAGDVFPDNRRFGVLWMGRRALAAGFDMEGAFNDVSLKLVAGAREAEVIQGLDRMLAAYGGRGAYGRAEQVSHRFVSDEIAQQRVTGTSMPVIFLGVAAFLLHTILSRLVATQRDQIAVLKAFGYENRRVGAHYLGLALAAVLPGAVLGSALGLWLGAEITDLYTRFYRFPLLHYEARPVLVVLAAGASSGAAVLGAFAAVRRAVGLPPAEAMRPEPPAHFGPGIAEWLGLRRLLPPAVRIVTRNLERRPVRTLLSVLAVALAVAIVVVGRYFFDAVTYMADLQFRGVQREDLTVVFTDPRPARAQHDLAALTGVLRVEPFRAVPVRLRHGHRMRRTELLGLEPGGQLRRVLDRDGAPVDVGPEGLVLTTKLGELLDARPGDTLRVEVLEGARPRRDLLVAGLADELIGVGAYMDRRALHRFLGEGRTLSGAYLAVDPARQPALYELLKRTPAVAGVGVRQAALAGFEQTLAQSFRISTTVLVVFACVIAFGVVYNGARIGLSERGWELASLRVLGFRRREVANMLLGEQAAITLAGVPLGCGIGWGICAALVAALDSELYRLPLVVTRQTYAFAFGVVVLAAFFSSLLVRWRLNRLDLVAVLKTRE
jgi:putative ABC transport system permease protein